MSPTCTRFSSRQPVFCCFRETDADAHDGICLTSLSFRWVLAPRRATVGQPKSPQLSLAQARGCARKHGSCCRSPSKVTDSFKALPIAARRMHVASAHRAHTLFFFSFFFGWGVGVQKTHLLWFTTDSATCALFNLHCCSSSLLQSAVVLIASSWWSQLPLLPEERCASLDEENKRDTID